MLKKKRSISLLIALTFLLSLLLPMGAVFAGTYSDITGAYQYVTTGENRSAGNIRVEESVVNGVYKWDSPADVTEVYVTVTLPSGVTYAARPTATTDYVDSVAGNVYFESGSTSSLQVKVVDAASSPNDVTFKFNVSNKSTLNISSDVTGDVKATVEVMGVSADGIEWVESETITIAKVQAKGVTVTADTPAVVSPGSNKDVAKITISESVYNALTVPEVVYMRVDTSGVNFNSSFVPSDITETRFGDVSSVEIDKNQAWFTVSSRTGSVPLPGKLEIVPAVDVPPSVTGDIQITVWSDKGDVPTTTVTVATVGSVPVAISDAKYTDGVIYAGHPASIVKSGSNPAQFKLKSTGGSIPAKMVIVELTAGSFDTTTPFEVKYSGGTLSATDIKLYNSNKSAWFEIPGTWNTKEITLSNFKIKAAGDAAEGDIAVKLSGTAGASGEVVIGKIAKPFTVTAESVPEIVLPSQSQDAGKIVITEAKKGAIVDDLVIKLPDGITFDTKPTVKVTSGNLSVSSTTVDGGKLTIDLGSIPSSLASTIEISGIKYNVGRLALEGDVQVKILSIGNGWESVDKVLATVVNAKVVTPVEEGPAPATFTIGSTSYKVGDAEKTMDVAPFIENGRTYLPVRYVAYAVGVSEDNIMWDDATATATLIKGDRVVQLTINSNKMLINGATITMDVPAKMVSGRTMLPIRWVGSALGASVEWNASTNTVTVTQ